MRIHSRGISCRDFVAGIERLLLCINCSVLRVGFLLIRAKCGVFVNRVMKMK